MKPREGFSVPETDTDSVSRRDALRFLLGMSGSAALGACNRQMPASGVESVEVVDRKTPFLKQWREALEKGLKTFTSNPSILGADGNKELVAIIRDFDLGGYIDDLAKMAKIRPEVVGGQIDGFSLKIPQNPNDSAMAEVEKERHMALYVNEWMRYHGKVHAPTIRATLRHELAHMFSFDYTKEDRSDGSIPFAYQPQTRGWQEREQLGNSLYEGATEVVARLGSKAFGERSVEQGYRGGATLSAYVLSKLLGEGEFLKAYLTRDTKLLKQLFTAKFGKWGAQELTGMVIIGGNLYGTDSLDFLHHACKHPLVGTSRVEGLLGEAQQEGIPERIAHVADDGCRMTTHLYQLNDADEAPRYAFNAVLEAPNVYRYGKLADSDGYRPKERFGIAVVNAYMSEEVKEKAIQEATKELVRDCSEPDPKRGYIVDAHARMGLDAHVLKALAKLDGLTPNSRDFETTWNGLNVYVVKQLLETVKEVYKRARVDNLIVEDQE